MMEDQSAINPSTTSLSLSDSDRHMSTVEPTGLSSRENLVSSSTEDIALIIPVETSDSVPTSHSSTEKATLNDDVTVHNPEDSLKEALFTNLNAVGQEMLRSPIDFTNMSLEQKKWYSEKFAAML